MDFIVLLSLALVLTIICFLWHQILLTLATMMAWFAAGIMVLVVGPPVSPFSTSTTFGIVMGFVIIVMAFVPLVRYLSQVGKTKVSHTDKTGKMWSLWEKPPEPEFVRRDKQVQNKRRQEIRDAVSRASRGHKS